MLSIQIRYIVKILLNTNLSLTIIDAMDQNLIIFANKDISTNSRKIWGVLTNPEKIKIYLYGTNTITD